MTHTIFFSWQASRNSRVCRNLIEQALRMAIETLAEDATFEEALRDGLELDKDTKNVPGSPPIFTTILAEIDKAAVFVPDLTAVAKREDAELIPNPNVLIEYGWALKRLGHSRMIPVLNSAYGDPRSERLPFDLAHLRFPITFDLPEGRATSPVAVLSPFSKVIWAKLCARSSRVRSFGPNCPRHRNRQPSHDKRALSGARRVFVPRASLWACIRMP